MPDCPSAAPAVQVDGETFDHVRCSGLHGDRWHRAVLTLSTGREIVIRWTDSLL